MIIDSIETRETSTSSIAITQPRSEQQPPSSTVIDLTLPDTENDRDTRESTVLGDDFVRPLTTDPPHNPDPDSDPIYRELATYNHTGLTLKPSKAVELQNGDFLRISSILQHRNTGQILVRGNRFRRNTKFSGLLEKKLNEVTMLLGYDF